MNNRKSKLLKIQKRYLSLIYQLNQYRLNREDPPDDLIEAISDMERTVKIIARAGRS
jgi:pantothenate kinase